MSALNEALAAADWWTGANPTQGEITTTDTMRILAAEVRRLQEIVADYGYTSEDDENV